MENREKKMSENTYCVSGANGYIGSYLVTLLLQRGYRVHATVRDPAKALHLLPQWNGGERLKLFKADMEEEGNFDEAVKGCHGVFHVAAMMDFGFTDTTNFENVQSNIIGPAIRGTLNLLNSCLKSKSVKRVVFTSSISTLTARDINGNWKAVVDEGCRTPIDQVLSKKASGWVYVLSKLMSEDAAFEYGKQNGIDIISVITSTVAGAFYTSSVPSSIQVLLSPMTGNPKFYSILSAVNDRMGSIALVHIEDICSAHIFLMHHTEAEGKYICCASSCVMTELLDLLAHFYPISNFQRSPQEERCVRPCEISSKKLRELGFSYKHDIRDTIQETISYCMDYGFLPHIDGRSH